MGESRMRTKRLILESIIGVFIGMITFIYRWWMLQNMPDFGVKDFVYSMILVPVFFFVLAYIIGRWVFHFTVCTVNHKGILVLWIIEVIVLVLYFLFLGFFMIIKYTNLWLEVPFLQSCYARILVFFGSPVHIVTCVFAGILFSLVIIGKELLRNK